MSAKHQRKKRPPDAEIDGEFPQFVRDEARDQVRWGFSKSFVAGVHLLEGALPSIGAPVVSVWFRFVGHDPAIDVVGLFVEARLRRLGLARRALETLKQGYGGKLRLVTGSLSSDGRELWRALGRLRTDGGNFYLLLDRDQPAA